MACITLAEAKRHLNIEDDFEDDDQYISSLIAVAQEVVAQDICVPLAELEGETGEIPAPADFAPARPGSTSRPPAHPPRDVPRTTPIPDKPIPHGADGPAARKQTGPHDNVRPGYSVFRGAD